LAAIGSNDLGKAMRRFNQGWLLDPHNGRVYWGFAVVLQIRDNNLPASIKIFNRARKLLPNDPPFCSIMVAYWKAPANMKTE